MPVDTVRETALKILHDIDEKGAYSNLALGKYLEGRELRDVDRSFITELVYGTVKWKLTIDWIIGQFSKVPLKKISPWISDILRLGVYQLVFTDRIPASAACNESVELAKRYGHEASSRFVNGLLRNISRNKTNLKYPDKEKNYVSYLCVRYSFPEWIVREWLDLYPKDFTESLLESANGKSDFTIRLNRTKTSKEALKARLSNDGTGVSDGRYLDECLILTNPPPLSGLETFRNGFFQVQDESSMLVAKILDPRPGETIMDVCSAPGGKATHIAEIMGDTGTVLARDIHEHKLKLIDDASRRLGLSSVRTELYDAALLDASRKETADRVLVDAPCTGLGILRRKPDIKWAKSSSDRKEIISLQKKILRNASAYVKPGGALVYCTCTLGPWENEDVVGEFINSNGSFTMEDLNPLLPNGLYKPEAAGGFIHMYPNIDGTDGFFISKMRRR